MSSAPTGAIAARLQRLVLKVLALGSFLGGPLFFADAWRPELGQKAAFVLAFLPIGLLGVCTLIVLEERLGAMMRISAWLGAAAGLGLVAMDGVALARLWAGQPHPNAGLIQLGAACGLVAVALYGWTARRYF